MGLKTVLYDSQSQVATLTLNRPEALNALNAELGLDLGKALREAASDNSIRVIVLVGAGRAFCAGGDLKAMAAGVTEPASPNDNLTAILRSFHDVISHLQEMEKPVVAAIHGPAVGAGMSIALACDLRIASDDATFSQAFIRIGLSPDGGSTWLLPRLVGPARAAQLMMTGETLDGGRAYEWGLVNQVVAPGEHLARALEVARQLVSFSPLALASIKKLLRSSPQNTFAEQLEAEAIAQGRHAGSDEFRAALAAFLRRKHQ